MDIERENNQGKSILNVLFLPLREYDGILYSSCYLGRLPSFETVTGKIYVNLYQYK